MCYKIFKFYILCHLKDLLEPFTVSSKKFNNRFLKFSFYILNISQNIFVGNCYSILNWSLYLPNYFLHLFECLARTIKESNRPQCHGEQVGFVSWPHRWGLVDGACSDITTWDVVMPRPWMSSTMLSA